MDEEARSLNKCLEKFYLSIKKLMSILVVLLQTKPILTIILSLTCFIRTIIVYIYLVFEKKIVK